MADCVAATGTVSLVLFWAGAVLLALVIRQQHGLTLVQTLRVMVGLRVPEVQPRPWVMWSALALVAGVGTIWAVLVQGCAG